MKKQIIIFYAVNIAYGNVLINHIISYPYVFQTVSIFIVLNIL